MGKTIIVSNRLPVKLTETAGGLTLTPSEGGLATGLGSIYRQGSNVWIGWPGMDIENVDEQREIQEALEEENLKPVFLTQEEINQYYEGFSNEVIWPVFHYMNTYAKYQQSYWDYYVRVNKKFVKAVLEIAEKDDVIWIQDYQLLLMPGLIRKAMPGISIGFFQHIPFPSYELFRLIPWRSEILEGMLGADLLGFHTYDDARHFAHACRRLIGTKNSSNIINYDNRAVVVDSFPMGIDANKFEQLSGQQAVQSEMQFLRDNFLDFRMVLSIDRLDYSKGIMQRLQAFELLLQMEPSCLEKVVLYMVVVPSRDTVPQYKELRDEIDKFVGNINARYRTIAWQPVYYFYRSFPLEHLSALYNMASVCLVTPMRDGMNLVCKEYVASRVNEDGVLVLSEMAGASKELIDALLVNPNDIGAIAGAIREGLFMSPEEQKRRMQSMRQIVKKFDINHWVKNFMDKLKDVKELQESMYAKQVGFKIRQEILQSYNKAKRRLIFLDYDGTLVGFKTDIEQAFPDVEVYTLLERLMADPANELVIVSGRNPEFLQKWFGKLNLYIIAEHGAWTKEIGKDWEQTGNLDSTWKKDLLPVMERFSDRTPGAFIEEKSFSLVWHYRKVEEELGEVRTNELMNTIRYLAEDRGLQLLPGNKVVEVKNIDINKGKTALQIASRRDYDFIMALGDDHTDEDIFKALPPSAITIKVGTHISAAKYYVGSFLDVRRLLHEIADRERVEV
ncbi:MAG TPA: bifunctional alpha,alpha-trehalose-phosphate synthase (UDP-forming)/trehalose-phosphatase [Flavitalea sp.]|nr:bifunctional alpha,alpha-trehalose-phosphate synthase (UDP-forming)/trehalose-phosphatase [Flavitalea sp.]